MKKGLAIAFFVIAIIVCASRVDKSWSLFHELLVGSVPNASDDSTIDQIETRVYALGGIEWAYVYELDGELDINVEGHDYDPELFPDYCRNICDEVMNIMVDYPDRELGFIYIEQKNSANNDAISWYTDDGEYGYFVYTNGDSENSYDNISLEDMGKIIAGEAQDSNNLPAMGGALG